MAHDLQVTSTDGCAIIDGARPRCWTIGVTPPETVYFQRPAK